MNIKKGGDIKNLFNEIIHNNYTYNNSSQQVLNSYGHIIIQSIQIRKSPINKSISKFINTFNKMNYDNYYHLDMVINNKIKIEKNERINISLDTTIYKNSVGIKTFEIYNIPSDLTINELLSNCHKMIGNELFFTYSGSLSKLYYELIER